jgi:hypothetical protein
MSVIANFCAFYTSFRTEQVESLGDIYAHNIRFVDPVTEHSGLVAVKHYFSSLMSNVTHCEFSIDSAEQLNQLAYVQWQMRFSHQRLGDKEICLDGVSQLRIESDLVNYQRDYYDLGQMLYEQVPLVGSVNRYLKARLSQ